MTSFDPETGLRLDASQAADEVAPSAARPMWRPNPFLVALTGIWALGGLIGVISVGGWIALAPQGLPLLVFGVLTALAAVAAGIAHLTVLAIAWRAPEAPGPED